MESTTTIHGHTRTSHAGYAFIEVVLGLVAVAAIGLWSALQAFIEERTHAGIRRELNGLSDHMLKDIGLTRTEIDGLFR